MVGDQDTYGWGENKNGGGPRQKYLKSGRSMAAGQGRNCWGQGNQIVVSKTAVGVWGPYNLCLGHSCSAGSDRPTGDSGEAGSDR